MPNLVQKQIADAQEITFRKQVSVLTTSEHPSEHRGGQHLAQLIYFAKYVCGVYSIQDHVYAFITCSWLC